MNLFKMCSRYDLRAIYLCSKNICLGLNVCLPLTNQGISSTEKNFFLVNHARIQTILADGIQSQIRMSSLSTDIKMNEDPEISTFPSL